MLEYLLIQFDSAWSRAVSEIAHRGLWEWLMATFPLLIFGDFLYYFVPVVAMAFLTRVRRTRELQTQAHHRYFLSRCPKVSVIIAGRNEERSIANCIRSLREQEYPNLEIIVVDDASTDRTYEIAQEFAQRGEIRLLRNNAALGRGGRASATNLGIRAAQGEFIISVDADTTFDRDLILHMVGPFCNPKVGAVAGNLKVRNARATFVTHMQAIEYLVGIGLGKRWADLRNLVHSVSGALGAFRRKAVLEVGQWDAELAEDTDVGLKLLKAGWRIRFAPRAIAMTDAPETWRAVGRQRYRWDRGTLRTYYHKHGGLLNPFRYRISLVTELVCQYFFGTVASFLYAGYVLFMLLYNPWALMFAMMVAYILMILASVASTLAGVWNSERRGEEWPLVFWSAFLPFYREYLRWIRLKANTYELLRIQYEDPFLPESAWRTAPRW